MRRRFTPVRHEWFLVMAVGSCPSVSRCGHHVVVQDTVRRATAEDQAAIIRLVREARLNPRSLRWERFVVADRGGELIGAAQVRRHPDGSRELASLVVRPQERGHGIAGTMIDTLLADEPGPVFTVVDRRYAEHFRSWDFDPVDPAHLAAAPPANSPPAAALTSPRPAQMTPRGTDTPRTPHKPTSRPAA
jgi:N-acetylglutamate synthase-like GNAT family acetyltransferase